MNLRNVARTARAAVVETAGRLAGRVQEVRPLTADLLESDEEYLVVFDAPGATSGDVHVRFVDGEVVVRLERFREFHEGYEMRFPGRGLTLEGRVELPEEVDPDAATATLRENGTLHVTIPMIEEGDTVEEETVTIGEEEDEGTDETLDDAGSEPTDLEEGEFEFGDDESIDIGDPDRN